MNSVMPRIVFDKSAKKDILEILDKTTDADGTIVEKDNPSQKVLTFEGDEITLEEFGGVQKGSQVFIRNNLISLIRLSKR